MGCEQEWKLAEVRVKEGTEVSLLFWLEALEDLEEWECVWMSSHKQTYGLVPSSISQCALFQPDVCKIEISVAKLFASKVFFCVGNNSFT